MATEIEVDLNREFNDKAKEYLKQIKEDYYEYLSDDKKKFLDELIEKDNIVIESDYSKYKEVHPGDIPTAHGGRVFDDGLIHIYEPSFKENQKYAMESVMIHELFHYLIRPEDSVKYTEDEKMRSYISEGLVDLYTTEFMKKRNIFPDYLSNYYGNILFVRDRLDYLPDEESKHQFSFNASVDQIVENTANTPEEFLNEYHKSKDYTTDYDELLKKVAMLSPDKQRAGDYFKGLMRLSARVGKNEALHIIMETIKELNPYDIESKTPEEIQSFQVQTSKVISEYLQKTPEIVK